MRFFDKIFKQLKGISHKTEDERETKCPYCQQELLKFPSRKTKCHSCGNLIYVRTRSSDRQRILVTERQLEKLEKDWREYRRAAEFKRRLKDSSIGFTERKYLKVKRDLAKRFGFEPSESDILWGLSNQLLVEAVREDDWQKMKMIYFNQALFVHNEGKDCFELLQEVAKCELMNYRKSGIVKKVEILTCGEQSCLACQGLSGKILTIKKALKEMLIPVRDCSFKFNQEAPTGWCRCCYIPVVE